MGTAAASTTTGYPRLRLLILWDGYVIGRVYEPC